MNAIESNKPLPNNPPTLKRGDLVHVVVPARGGFPNRMEATVVGIDAPNGEVRVRFDTPQWDSNKGMIGKASVAAEYVLLRN